MVVNPMPARTYTVRFDEDEGRWVVRGGQGEKYAIYDEMVTAIATARDMARDNQPAQVILEDVLGELHLLASFDGLPPDPRR